jgi:hypothetical protein
VTASSENSEFPVENAYDWLLTDFFQPAASGQYTITCVYSTPVTADCMAFYGTDLDANGGTIKLQYLESDLVTWTDASNNITVTGTEPYVEYFTSQTSTQWRFVIDSTPVSSIGHLFFGEYMGLELGVWEGFTPPKFQRNNEYITNVSQSGNFIGRSIVYEAGIVNLAVDYMTMDWARSDWLPFIKHAEQKPFFFTWNNANYGTEHAFAWSNNTSFSASNRKRSFMQGSISMRVLTE